MRKRFHAWVGAVVQWTCIAEAGISFNTEQFITTIEIHPGHESPQVSW